MTEIANKERRRNAMRNFRRLIFYLVVAGVAMVVAALLYLARSGPLTGTLVFTATAGVFVSIVLGGGLMAAGFFSSNSGVDEEVAAAWDQRGMEPVASLDEEAPSS